MKRLWITLLILLVASFVIAQGTQHSTEQISSILIQQDPDIDGDLTDNEWWGNVNKLVKNNFTATSNPGVGNDVNDGYSVGSAWINTSTDKIFFCVNNASGAAIWYDPADEGFPNPMDTANDIIIGGANGAAEKLAGQPNSILVWDADGNAKLEQSLALNDAGYHVHDDGDPTKRVRIVADNVPSGQTVDLEAPGTSGKIALEATETNTLSGGDTLSADDCSGGKVHYLTSAGTFTIPSAFQGMDCKVFTVGNISGIAAPNGTQNFMYNGVALGNGETAPNNSLAGQFWKFFYYDNNTVYLYSNIGGGGGTPVEDECLVSYATDVNNEQPVYLGNSEWTAFAGGLYTPSVDEVVCQTEFFVQTITSTNATLPASYKYRCKIYSVNASSHAIISQIGDASETINGNALQQSTWSGSNAGYNVFNTNKPSLTAGQLYVILFFVDTDNNPDDTPERETGNFIYLSYQNEGGTNMGRAIYQEDLTHNTSEADDPVRIKVYTLQTP